VNVINGIEYYNTADDIKKNFPPGKTWVYRNLNTELGATGMYDFYLALWEGEKEIETGTKYASVMISKAVEKKKRIFPMCPYFPLYFMKSNINNLMFYY